MSPIKLNENFENKIRNNKKKINNEIVKAYLVHQNPSFMAKEL